MKKRMVVLCFLQLIILGSCKNNSERTKEILPESSYLGEWKVTYTNDQNLTYDFLEDKIIIKDGNGKSSILPYHVNQKTDKYINFTEADSEMEITLTLHFPYTTDLSTAVLLSNVTKEEPLSDNLFAVMNREEYIDYTPYYDYQEYLE
ncbi:hypothetical protein ACYSNR_14105 [Enterococcus sp. LJL128]